MNWEAVGALAELAGAAGVVVTLAYLSVQLRQNTRAIQGSEVAYQSNLEMATNTRFFDLRRDIYLNPELASIWTRGLVDPASLAEGEWDRFRNYFVSFVLAMGEQYRIQANLLVDRHQVFAPVFEDLFRYPGAHRAWGTGFGYDVEFTDFLSKICDATRVRTPEELRRRPSLFFPAPPAEE
jgi:hypothetical protein